MQKRVAPWDLAVRAASQHGVERQDALGFDGGRMARALAAIAAILGTGAGLDAQQRADLDGIGIEVGAMEALGVEQQIVERLIEDSSDFVERPIVAECGL
jgi:hypothetical protein